MPGPDLSEKDRAAVELALEHVDSAMVVLTHVVKDERLSQLYDDLEAVQDRLEDVVNGESTAPTPQPGIPLPLAEADARAAATGEPSHYSWKCLHCGHVWGSMPSVAFADPRWCCKCGGPTPLADGGATPMR
jgi:hypothetical protein